MIFVSMECQVNMKIQKVKQPDKKGRKQLINCPLNADKGILLNGTHPDVLLAPVAQWIEQRFPKPCVVSSTLTRGTTIFRN